MIIDATMKTNLNVCLASGDWITGVFLEEKHHRLYIVANQTILVRFLKPFSKVSTIEF
jgi:hypothetical protein